MAVAGGGLDIILSCQNVLVLSEWEESKMDVRS